MSGNHLTLKRIEESDDYAPRPCYPELMAIIVAGALHVATEVALSPSAARRYNVFVSLCLLVYGVWRASHTKSVLRLWGMRRDNFWVALRAQLSFGAIAALLIVGFGLVKGPLPLSKTFWLTLGLYPVWGIAQQFALQNLIAKNVTGLLSHPFGVAFVSAVLFGMAHWPRGSLVLIAFFAAFFFTWIHQRFPNLWAVGIVHGIVGTLAIYIVVGEDPGAKILAFLFP